MLLALAASSLGMTTPEEELGLDILDIHEPEGATLALLPLGPSEWVLMRSRLICIHSTTLAFL
jgi:hypothetical protein